MTSSSQQGGWWDGAHYDANEFVVGGGPSPSSDKMHERHPRCFLGAKAIFWVVTLAIAIAYVVATCQPGLLPDDAQYGLASIIIFKTLPIWLLAFYLMLLPWHTADAKHDRYTWSFVVALFLCSGGDVALEFDSDTAFMVGLSLFLLGHVAYIVGFGIRPFKPLYLLVPASYMAYFLGDVLLVAAPEDMQVPLIVYGIAIGVAGWRALAATHNPEHHTGDIALVGALAFIISDSILAYNLFVAQLPYASALIMGTYYAAQFLFAIAAIGKNCPGSWWNSQHLGKTGEPASSVSPQEYMPLISGGGGQHPPTYHV